MAEPGPGFPAQEPAPWFAFLGQALLLPDAARLAELLDELERATEAGAGEPLVAVFREALEGDPLELQKEHVRLFLDPAGAPCPPWQSVWGEEPRLMGPAHERALEWFRAEGIEPVRENEPADHAGLLLMFFSRLASSGAPTQRLAAFWRDHLEWIIGFSERIESETRHPFYRAWAEAAARLVRQTQPPPEPESPPSSPAVA
jgi:TorA maturation chaperone TorD